MLLLRRFWIVFKPFLAASINGRLLCVAVLSLCLLSAGMNIAISYMNRDFFSAITAKDVPAFHRGLRNFIGVIALAVPVDAYFGYVQQLLSLRWRTWLTDHLLDRYLDDSAGRPYYQLSGGQAGAGGGQVSFNATFPNASQSHPVTLPNPINQVGVVHGTVGVADIRNQQCTFVPRPGNFSGSRYFAMKITTKNSPY